uniref:Phosphodiester glycosidase domain-containing protein n=1 Tax=mine drainage metagenome TaxID=410659 RepID=E6Q4V2_9ZZZZ
MISARGSLRAVAASLLLLGTSAIAPPQPFPRILAETVSHERIAPGLLLARYRLVTPSGPIHAAVLAFDPHDPRLALVPFLAHHTLVGARERLSSMLAEHPRAVAAVNGDYFAISGDGAPIGGLVRNATLLRSPYPRAMFSIDTNGDARIGEIPFQASLSIGATTLPLAAIDRRVRNGTALFLPSYGAIPVLPDATLIALEPLAGTPPFTSYRVLGTADNLRTNAAGYYLAYGLDDEARIGIPEPGATLQVAGTFGRPGEPAPILTAFGGGPLFLLAGKYRHDPEGPNGASFAVPIPTTAIGITSTGRVLFVEIDGKSPHYSIGLTRRELAAFMVALGARDAMALDGGGSSVMLARTLGSMRPRVLGHPSDGGERRIAEGIAIENTAPIGAASALAVRPQRIRALVGARVALQVVRIDAALHALGAISISNARIEPSQLGTFEHGSFVARASGHGTLVLRDGSLHATVALDIPAQPASLTIHPRLAAVAANGSARFRAVARDRDGAQLALPKLLPWQAIGARIDPSGFLLAGSSDASVRLEIGGIAAMRTVRVGSRSIPLHLASIARFLSVPSSETGSVAPANATGGIELFYDFSGEERAAFALLEQPLPPHTTALSFDVRSPGNGGFLRVAMRDARNDDILLTAERLDRPGMRSLRVAIPATAMPPLRLTGIYVVRALGPGRANRSAGKIELSNLRAWVAGSASEEP